jgi:Golgi-body localisation protein domain/RNA pol II promoter Fmp27 protein domain
LQNYDAFRGFRSDYIHLSIAVAAPFDRDWTASTAKPADSYNAVHLSPRFFSHFWDWWSLFSGVMALPVRQGPLWRGQEKSSKKFGRHLATIKYGLLLSPLFIAHVYKHKDAEDYQEDVVSATGLKLRINNFMLDLHQRREYFDTLSKGKSEQTRTSALKMNRAEVDFVSADLRAVAASIGGTTAEDLMRATDEILSSYQDPSPSVDMSQFSIPDLDFSWIDMDDFVELDWTLPAESNPETKILPLAFTPRFTYFRQTEHGNSISGDETRTSPFGDEPSHFCVMSQHNNDPKRVQMDLVKARLDDIIQQIAEHKRLMGEQELRVIRDGDQDESLQVAYDSLVEQEAELQTKRRFLEHGLRKLAEISESGGSHLEHHHNRHHNHHHDHDQSHLHVSTSSFSDELPAIYAGDMDGLTSSLHEDFATDFNNRFIIHNIQLKWNNALRNIILRYSHQVSQRRGFVYYMSRRAVKFILDIVDEQTKSKDTHHVNRNSRNPPRIPSVISPNEEKDDDAVVNDRINQLLNDAKRFVHADEAETTEEQSQQGHSTADTGEKIAEHFQAMNSYHIRLIAPQIQLQSEKNTKSVVLVSAKGMHFKVVAIMDKARMSDDVSGLVQRRFSLDMDGAQFFVTTQKSLVKFLHLYSGNNYGNAPGSSWPPWVSLEVMFDFQLNPFGFHRVIQKTSASLRYEKYNQLRLKYNEEVASKEVGDEGKHPERKESRIDHLLVDFPRVRARCDSAQYYTMYVIVLDLLLYSEPLEKTRNERLEKIMLASDFSDLRGAPEMATSLQERIRQLEDIKTHFQINAKYLDKEGWQDRINLEKDLSSCEDELFFIMKAITTSQQKNDDRKSSLSSSVLRWYLSASEIVWHLMRDKNEPLLEFQLGKAAYERIDNSDGSNHNAMEIQQIRGLNLLPNALYPDIIGPFDDPQKPVSENEQQKMLQVQWYMLEAIAGIPVLEQFIVNLHPLKVQLERDLGKKLFEYIFPGVGQSSVDDGSKNFSPLMVKHMQPMEEQEDAEAEEAENLLSPDISSPQVSQEELHSFAPGGMGRRLKPTFNLNHCGRHGSLIPSLKTKGLGISSADHRHGLFKHANDLKMTASHSLARKSSASSLQSTNRKPSSSTSLVALNRFEENRKHSQRKSKRKKEKPSDDLSQMLSRASNYMTLAEVRLTSVVICLSYKGKGDRNLEDLHSLVFRMPTLEYRNKTWSNLDLALRLKKDVIKALISHTGAIIGNKFSHNRPNKQQQTRLRELASSHTLIPNSETLVNTPSTSETASLYSLTPNRAVEEGGSMVSFQSMPGNGNGSSSSAGPSPLMRNDSFSSSLPSTVSSPNFQVTLNNPGIGPPTRTTTNDPLTALRPSTSTSSSPHRSLLKDTLMLGRHFSNETARAAGRRGGSGAEAEDGGSDAEGHKKKSVLLLGKKILGR